MRPAFAVAAEVLEVRAAPSESLMSLLSGSLLLGLMQESINQAAPAISESFLSSDLSDRGFEPISFSTHEGIENQEPTFPADHSQGSTGQANPQAISTDSAASHASILPSVLDELNEPARRPVTPQPVVSDKPPLFNPSHQNSSSGSFVKAAPPSGMGGNTHPASDSGDDITGAAPAVPATDAFTFQSLSYDSSGEWNEPPSAGDDWFYTKHDEAVYDNVMYNDYDIDGDPISATLVSDVRSGQLNFNSDGSFDYTPDALFVGTDSFSYLVSDGLDDSETATVTIDVWNETPSAGDDWFYTKHDEAVYDNVMYNDYDIDGDGITAILVSGPSSGVLTDGLSEYGDFEYVPNEHFVGTDSFTYKLTDGIVESEIATVTIDVWNETPLAGDDWFYTKHDEAVYDNVMYNDYDIDGDGITAILVSGPSNGQLTDGLSELGDFEYVPNEHFVGTDSFTYKLTDGIVESEIATATIDVWNETPSVTDDEVYTSHDEAVFWNVLENDYDIDGDEITAILVSSPSNGQLTDGLSEYGDFEYQPDPLFVGTDTFTYKVTDGLTFSSVATVTIYVTNEAPWAIDDYFEVFFDPIQIPVVLPVTLNDFDPNGDPISVINVSSTTEGGEVSISSSGLDVLYILPTFLGTEIEIGGVVYLDDMPTNTEPAGDDGGQFEPFEDFFTYSIADNVGAFANANVQVQMQNVPEWKKQLLENFNEAAEVGIDGSPGYDLNIRQTFGVNAPGSKAAPKTQTWQKNVQNVIYIYVDKDGVMQNETGKNRILADTNNLAANSRTPLKITDQMSLQPGDNAASVALIIESVDKTLGLNKPNATLPVPPGNKQPWEVTTDEHKQLLDQMNAQFGTLSTKTTYLYVDKQVIENLHNQGKINNAVYNGIKTNLMNQFGLNYNNMPDKFETYTIDGLGTWTSPTPP